MFIGEADKSLVVVESQIANHPYLLISMPSAGGAYLSEGRWPTKSLSFFSVVVGFFSWKPTPAAAINFRHFLKTSISRGSLLPSSGHALHWRGLYFHDVARTASRGATSLSGEVAWKDWGR